MQDHISLVSITELKQIKGGISLSGPIIEQLILAGKAILSLGRSFGVTLRCILRGSFCNR